MAYLLKRNQIPDPEDSFRDLYNASPSLLSQALYDTNKKEWPEPTLVERVRKTALSVRTIQGYVRDKVSIHIEPQDPEFIAVADAETNAYLAQFDQKKVVRFNQIVEAIRAIGEQENMDILKLKKLALEQYELLYGKKDSSHNYHDYRRNLGLPDVDSGTTE